MGFNTGDSNNGNGNGNNRGNFEKADGFLNLYLPGKNGRKKLGAIALRKSNDNEAQLIAWLQEDPARVSVLLQKLEIDFVAVDKANVGFVLDDTPAKAAA